MRLTAGIWAVTLAGARRHNAPIYNRSFTTPFHAHVNPIGGCVGRLPGPRRNTTRPAESHNCRSAKNSPNKAPPATFPRKSSPGAGPSWAQPRKTSPSAAPPAVFSRKSSPSTPQNANFGPLFVRRANFFALTPTIRPSRANFFAHRTQPRGNCETDITTAPESCTKNAQFSPAKAMAVSVPHRHQRAKATMVSDNRVTSPAAPKRGARGRRRGLALEKSHAIRLDEVSIMSENVAIPTV